MQQHAMTVAKATLLSGLGQELLLWKLGFGICYCETSIENRTKWACVCSGQNEVWKYTPGEPRIAPA